MGGERVLAIGDSVGDVLGWDEVEVVVLRPTFVVVKATRHRHRRDPSSVRTFVTLLDGERTARATIDLFDPVPPPITD
jgi:hypothetical protein